MSSLLPHRTLGLHPAAEDGAALAQELAAAVLPGHWDELRGGVSDGLSGGPLTALWERFFRLLGPAGIADLDSRQQQLLQQIRDDGIADAAVDGAQARRDLPVGLFPLLIDPAAWAQISSGVAQRAALLNAILDDVYAGAQRCLESGLLPPELVRAHPGYLPAVRGIVPPGRVWLHIAAFDLAHGPDGVWRVVDQRLQAPSGLGAVLQNRLLVSALFPEAFNQLRVQRLAASYRLLLDALLRLSPGGAGSRIVLLAPGAQGQVDFEPAHLARYLGIPLAEGGDLTVREQRLFLKTLRGLEPVHVVLRLLDDDCCDPSELGAESPLGVPGLLQAVRAGQVLLANALGAGFLESPAVLGYLPRLCETLRGEPLALPSLQTCWCGAPGACDQALDDLRSWVVKPVHADCGFEPTAMAELDFGQLPAWRARVLSQPDTVALQQYLPPSQLAVWSDGGFAARAALLRVYALSDGRGGWQALPGGLVRTAPRGGNAVSQRHGGSTLDAWVIVDDATNVSAQAPEPIRPPGGIDRHRVVTSRAAENLYQLGRASERAEFGTRLARIALRALSGDDDLDAPVRAMLDQWCRRAGLIAPAAPALDDNPQGFARCIVRGLVPGPHQGDIVHSLQALGQAAAQVRERLGSDHRQWIAAATALELVPEDARRDTLQDAAALRGLERLTELLSAITGAQTDRMTRDDGWRLLSIGRHIARLQLHGDALRVALRSGALQHDSGFSLLLALFDSLITYRALYQKRLELAPLLDLLMLDRENPRALGWVAQTLRARMDRLPADADDKAALLALAPDPAQWQLSALCAQTEEGHHAALDRTLSALVDDVQRLSDAVSRRYFTHARTP